MAKKVNNANEMKRSNKQKLMESLRISSKSRAELARETGLTRAAITILIDSMIEDGILSDGEWVDGGMGRRTIGLKINGDKYHIISIHLARDFCSVGLADFAGNITAIRSVDTTKISACLEDALQYIGNMTAQLLQDAPPKELLGIGISAPGPLDSEKGYILTPTYFNLWHHANITEWFRQKFQCPVYLENNAKTLALAEKYYGCGHQYRNYIEIIVDTGVGSGIMLNGKLYRGMSGFAGEIGHMSIDLNGEICACGNRGCLELYASIPNLLKYGRPLGAASWKELVDMTPDNAAATQLYEREIHLLAGAIINVLNFMDLEAVILAGDILYHSEELIQKLEQKINQAYIGRENRQIIVRGSELQKNAHILSGVNLVLEHYNREMI